MTARILVGCSREEEQEFLDLARRCKVSPSVLGGLAIRQMLIADKAGARPMIKPHPLPTLVKNYNDTESWDFSEDWSKYL